MPSKLAYVVWVDRDSEIGGGPTIPEAPPPEVWPRPPEAGKPPGVAVPPIYLPVESAHPIVLPPGEAAPPEIWPKPPGGEAPGIWPILPSHPIVIPPPPPDSSGNVPAHPIALPPGLPQGIPVHPIWPPSGYALIWIPGFGFAMTPIGPSRPRPTPQASTGHGGRRG